MQQQPRLPLWFLLVNWALIVGAFALGLLVGGRGTSFLPEPQRTALEMVQHQILKSHVSPPTANELLENALAGMVEKLDPYSRYVPPRDLAKYLEQNTGHYQGIGCEVRYTADAAVLFFPMPGRSLSVRCASRAGMSCGCSKVMPSGFFRSLATLARNLFVEMPMLLRRHSPTFCAMPSLMRWASTTA